MSSSTMPAAPQRVATRGDAPLQSVASGGSTEGVVGVVATDVATDASPRVQPMIVRSADVHIVVGDTAKAMDAVTKSIEAMGGYVAGSSVWREGELLRARVTLRVPSDKLTAALGSIRGVAKRVQNETLSSEDVSQEFVDLEARLRNLEATESELRQLLAVARQNSRKASEVLAVHEQVMMIRGQIEQAKGRMRYLSQVASMSQIALELIPDAIAQPVVEPGWQPQVVTRDAARALVHAIQSVASVAIWLVIYVLPIFGTLALMVTAVWRLARKEREREG